MIHFLHVSLEFFSEKDLMYIVIMGQGRQDSPVLSQTPGKNPFHSGFVPLIETGGPDQSSCKKITASQLDYGWFWRSLWFLPKKVFKKAHVIFKDQSDWLALIFCGHEKSLKWCVRLFSRFSILFSRSNLTLVSCSKLQGVKMIENVKRTHIFFLHIV